MKARSILLTIATLFLLYCLLCFPQALLQKENANQRPDQADHSFDGTKTTVYCPEV